MTSCHKPPFVIHWLNYIHILIYYMYFTCTIYDIVLPNKYLSIYLSIYLLWAKRAKFFFEKLALVPLNSLYPFKLSVQNTHSKKIQGLPIEISRKVTSIQGLFKDKFILKEFSRKTQNSRSFQGLWEPCNAGWHFKFGLNECARVIRGKFTFATDSKSFQLIRT